MASLSGLRILLAEDEALVRQGMTAILETEDCLITEACDGKQAMDMLKSQKFDVALIDIGLPVRTGLDVLSEVRARGIAVKIIMLTGDTHSYSPAHILKAGADGFLYKTANAEAFMQTITDVIDGKTSNSAASTESEAQLSEGLTPRELQIVKLVAEGAPSKQIANVLNISEHTVRKHREHINRKLDLSSPAALAVFAIKAKLV